MIKKKSYSKNESLVKKEILSVGITNESQENILEFLIKSLQNYIKPYYVVTPNPEMIVLANHDGDFANALNGAELALNDGVGIGVAARILGVSLHERFSGVDFMENVCEAIVNQPITVGFLGAGPHVAELAVKRLIRRYPNLKIAFVGQEWGEEGFDLVRKNLSNISPIAKNEKEDIQNNNSVDILFVAFGFPKQEFWMRDHVGKINVKVFVGVGGAFDYISGKVPRAPKVLRGIGLEWLFRLVVQPWRIKRQLALIEFAWMVLQKRLKLSFQTK